MDGTRTEDGGGSSGSAGRAGGPARGGEAGAGNGGRSPEIIGGATAGATTPPAVDAGVPLTVQDGSVAPSPDAHAADRRSAGCGKPFSGTSSFVTSTMTIRAVARTVHLWVPRSYAPSRAYPVIFKWHGSGGTGLSGGLEIERQSGEDAIVVAADGLNARWDLDPMGPDVELFDQLLAKLEATTCVDRDRIFSYGFSMGGMMSELLGCVRGDVIRAIAPVEGFMPSMPACVGRAAAWIVNSVDDQAVTIDRGRQGRDAYLLRNGCGTTSQPVSPAPCVRYDGCAADYGVTWCQTTGPHNPQSGFAAPGAWAFFKSLAVPATN